ncbi:hypothetical protein SAMN05444141_101691 [Pseudovibrio denitrificans]|uniref:Uncharacterized protein n=1 Tax=Pseudovibrio denitrificans TaxID=258256 RepID=A0A1I6Y7P8_9HYPH|nr:hypothetical protein SAMN05444141_101691 [Pseudovibrio denitrificans]
MTNFVETVSYPEQKRRHTVPMHILMMKGRFERSRAFHALWRVLWGKQFKFQS